MQHSHKTKIPTAKIGIFENSYIELIINLSRWDSHHKQKAYDKKDQYHQYRIAHIARNLFYKAKQKRTYSDGNFFDNIIEPEIRSGVFGAFGYQFGISRA